MHLNFFFSIPDSVDWQQFIGRFPERLLVLIFCGDIGIGWSKEWTTE